MTALIPHALYAGTIAERDGVKRWANGDLYYASDTSELYLRRANAWDAIAGVGGGVSAGDVRDIVGALVTDTASITWSYNVLAQTLEATAADDGHSHTGILGDGTNTGDIVRWNDSTEAWEVTPEPFAFTQINLTPAAAAVANVEGGMYYKSTDKKVYVCTEGS